MKPSKAASIWVATRKVPAGAKVSIVDVPSGIAASHRTAIGHYVTDAAEISVNGVTTLAALWLCGGSTVDGFVVDEPTPDCVACRLAAAIPQGPVVYYAWGEDDELLYVGSTIKGSQRIRAHSTQTRWWSEVRRLTFDSHATERDVRRAEWEAIRDRPGKYNRDGVNSRTLSGADTALLRLVEGGESA